MHIGGDINISLVFGSRSRIYEYNVLPMYNIESPLWSLNSYCQLARSIKWLKKKKNGWQNISLGFIY